MPNFNSVTVVGNLTKDPEHRAVGATSVTDFGMAINRKYKKADGTAVEETTFLDLQAWGKTAELVHQYVKKGQALLVRGSLRQDSWADKATGAKRSKIIVVADEIQFMGGRGDAKETATVHTAPHVPTAAASTLDDEPPF